MLSFLGNLFNSRHSDETPLQTYFRIEYGRDYEHLHAAGIKPNDAFIKEYTKSCKKR